LNLITQSRSNFQSPESWEITFYVEASDEELFFFLLGLGSTQRFENSHFFLFAIGVCTLGKKYA